MLGIPGSSFEKCLFLSIVYFTRAGFLLLNCLSFLYLWIWAIWWMYPLKTFSPNTWICLFTLLIVFDFVGELYIQFVYFLFNILLPLFPAKKPLSRPMPQSILHVLFLYVCVHVQICFYRYVEARGQSWMSFLRHHSPFLEAESLTGLELIR